MPLAQLCLQRLFKHPAALDEQAEIDRFVRHVHGRIIRIRLAEPASVNVRGPIPGEAAVSPRLPTHGRGGPAQLAADLPQRCAGGQAKGDGLPFGQREREAGAVAPVGGSPVRATYRTILGSGPAHGRWHSAIPRGANGSIVPPFVPPSGAGHVVAP